MSWNRDHLKQLDSIDTRIRKLLKDVGYRAAGTVAIIDALHDLALARVEAEGELVEKGEMFARPD